MAILSPYKAIRSLRKTPITLQAILKPITQQMANELRDDDDGWSILFIMCHLYDYEHIYFERMQQLLNEDNPTLVLPPDNDTLSEQNKYADQNLREKLDGYLARRREFINLLEGLSDEQWEREGMHPNTGAASVLTFSVNVALHDINHIGQIVQAIGDITEL